MYTSCHTLSLHDALPISCCPGPDAVRAPRRRARIAIAADKIASFDAMAAAGVPAVGALDLRHPDLDIAIPARATLPLRGGMFGVPSPGADRLLALPLLHGCASTFAPRRPDHHRLVKDY